MTKIVGFLRGINVGGHHKVPMAELKNILTQFGCENVITILNSGNFVFELKNDDLKALENKIESVLAKSFGFAIPVILISHKQLTQLVNKDPFAGIDVHKNIRLYISFLKDTPKVKLAIPYISNDQAFSIIGVKDKIIASVLDITTTNTPKGMEDLEKLFGKNITTRNWNTIQKIHNC
ncbi:DUF1697 domain-containing protein [Sediminibacterium sp.]|uniref:DUF1697 domain-containing protein n=1 Tax=Sediminibacterium sp. TaxID=1917865 RepID=UPI002735B28E|nr:DUF1697 domain-containing protein [Sediminibacterium sp.]MDP3392542.1 DUF1697 domain-containing protein [Sediminibacterium sp.]MDP3565808.1 DUF1697 domain-containing protein [Sediminibacterium sp.]